jgi:glutamyl-tRNA reductase
MEFFCTGVSHHTATLNLREKLTFTSAELFALLKDFADQRESYLGAGAELVIVSTCNRFEVYAAISAQDGKAVSEADVQQGLIRLLADSKGLAFADIAPFFFHYHGAQAVEHLCRVAAGLDSMVLGEPQILGQVSEAFEQARQAGAARRLLSTLFRTALHTGKRARAETRIGHNPASIGSAAVRMAGHIAGHMERQRVLVIGAGEMSTLAVKAFYLQGVEDLTILNRTYERAVELAEHFGGTARHFADLPDALTLADVVITSTGANEPIILPEMVTAAMAARPHRPLILLDIAVPRDVAPAVREIEGVHIFDLDDLQQYLARSLSERREEAPHVEAIVHEEVASFMHWMEVIPVVGKLHKKAEAIRQQELERALRHLPELDPQVQAQMEHLSRSLVKKLLHEPTTRLREEAGSSELLDHMDSMKFLFGLDDNHASQID